MGDRDYTLWSHPHAREGIMYGERGWEVRVRARTSVERGRVRYLRNDEAVVTVTPPDRSCAVNQSVVDCCVSSCLLP